MTGIRKDAKVYVNGEARPYFPGITVRFAIGPDRAQLVAKGALQVVDIRGYLTGLDGSLAPGDEIFLLDKSKHTVR